MPHCQTIAHQCPRGRFEAYEPNPRLVAKVCRCEVRLEIAWNHQEAAPYVREYAVWLNDQCFGVIHKEAGCPGCTLRINLAHPSLLSAAKVQTHVDWTAGAWPGHLGTYGPRQNVLSRITSILDSCTRPDIEFQNDNTPTIPATATVVLKGQADALPRWEQTISLGRPGSGANQEDLGPAAARLPSLGDVAKVRESLRESLFGPPSQKYTSVDEVLKAVASHELVDVADGGKLMRPNKIGRTFLRRLSR